jgi:class 3 adenylate cyclase
MASAEEQIAESIDSTLLEQARKNELRIAYVRTSTLALTSAVNLAAHLDPAERAPVTNFAVTAALLALSLLLIRILRRTYRPWLRFLMPFADAGVVLLLFLTTTQRFDADYLLGTGVLVNLGAVCALLAVSGGLRLSRGSALITTALAAAIFAVGTMLAGFGALRTAFPMSLLLGAGLLGTWMTEIVRGSIKSEVARTILARFVPQRVIDDAHHNPLSLIAEPRSLDVTVVITDLRGFTSLAERASPAEVLGFLNRVQGELAEIVQRHGGTVDKFMGDGMLAVFGAPEPQDDHAVRALRAVSELVAAVFRIDSEGAARVRIGIGVHSGEVVSGCLGSGVRLEFTVIGDTVNTASRLESLTKEKGAVALVSEETLRRAEAQTRELPLLEPVGEVTLRGRTRPLLVHRLIEGELPRSLFPESLR